MSKRILFAVIVSLGAVAAGCGGVVTDNTNANTANSNVFVNIDPANMPPGLSTSPIQPGANSTPGISPANAMTNVPSNVSPAPGIPSADELKKPQKPGTTPTPGIPSQDELKRQMNKPPANANAAAGK